MRGEQTFKILSVLNEAEDMMLDMLGACIVSGLAYNPRKQEIARINLERAKRAQRYKKEEEREAMHRFYAMVRYLEGDGLIKREATNTKTVVTITFKGRRRLATLEEQISKKLPQRPYGSQEAKLKEGVLTIVTFDVPEKHRRKRDWMRNALREAGFSMVHRSVWMNKEGIPEILLEDMEDLELGDYVEIFQVTKSGSLRRLM